MVVLVGCASIVMFAFMPTYLNDGFNVLRAYIGDEINDPMFSVIKCLIIFGILAVFNACFDMYCTFVIRGAENKIIVKKMCEAKRKLDTAPIEFLEKYTVGNLSQRIATRVTAIVNEFMNTVYTIIRIGVFFITTSIMMFMINWILAIAVIFSLPLCVITARLASKKTQKYFTAFGKATTNTYTYIDQKFTLQDFYDLNGIGDTGEQFEKINAQHASTSANEETSIAFNTIYINYIQNFMYLLVTLLFGVLYVTQIIPTEFGVLPAFVMYSNRFLANAVVVTTATNLLQGITAKAPSVFEIFDYPENVTANEHIDIKHVKQGIAFNGVSLTQNNEQVLKKISFTIPQGASVAFLGAPSSGKTHIVDLMSKLSRPSGGEIMVDGINIDEITSKSYYKCVGIAMEQPFIFRGTVAENLLYGIRRELPENVMSVTEKLGSNAFIDALPNGYETWISENSGGIGKGQKQCICVARLVLQNPDVAVFHASLSATDAFTEKTVYETIMKMKKRQTTVFVTHRFASVEKCDTIYYMERGRIVESGTHKSLMAKKGKYFKAYTGG